MLKFSTFRSSLADRQIDWLLHLVTALQLSFITVLNNSNLYNVIDIYFL